MLGAVQKPLQISSDLAHPILSLFIISLPPLPTSLSQRNARGDMSSTGTSRQKDHSIQTPHHIHYPFWFGGSASCFAAAVTHPLDLSTSAKPYQENTERFKANRVNSKGRGRTLGRPEAQAYSMQVRLQTRAPDGPKGMFGTFVHILKTDSALGLYSGVGLPHLSLLPFFLSSANPQASNPY